MRNSRGLRILKSAKTEHGRKSKKARETILSMELRGLPLSGMSKVRGSVVASGPPQSALRASAFYGCGHSISFSSSFIKSQWVDAVLRRLRLRLGISPSRGTATGSRLRRLRFSFSVINSFFDT